MAKNTMMENQSLKNSVHACVCVCTMYPKAIKHTLKNIHIHKYVYFSI